MIVSNIIVEFADHNKNMDGKLLLCLNGGPADGVDIAIDIDGAKQLVASINGWISMVENNEQT